MKERQAIMNEEKRIAKNVFEALKMPADCTLSELPKEQEEQFVHVVNEEVPTKAERKATRRKVRFLIVESIRVLVTTLFLFAVAAWDGVFFPFVFLLAVTVLLSVLEYEADDLE